MSEFGKGLSYCLGLFLCHSERDYLITESDIAKGIINRPHMWFYSAADHIFELSIPSKLPNKLKVRLRNFKNKVMGWRLPMNDKDNATQEDVRWVIQEAKDLLKEIDIFNGIKAVRGDWE